MRPPQHQIPEKQRPSLSTERLTTLLILMQMRKQRFRMLSTSILQARARTTPSRFTISTILSTAIRQTWHSTAARSISSGQQTGGRPLVPMICTRTSPHMISRIFFRAPIFTMQFLSPTGQDAVTTEKIITFRSTRKALKATKSRFLIPTQMHSA